MGRGDIDREIMGMCMIGGKQTNKANNTNPTGYPGLERSA